MISIITICWNDLPGLKKTYASLLSQAPLNFEWIVIDGGSGSVVVDFLSGCDLVSKYVSEQDSGIYDAMRKGFLLSAGDYLCFLNAGDCFVSADVLTRVSKALSCDVVMGGANFVAPNGGYIMRGPRKVYPAILHSVPANQQATFFRRSSLCEADFVHEYSVCGDYYLIARVFKRGASFGRLDFPVVNFYLGGVSTFRLSAMIGQAWGVQRDVLRVGLYRRLLSAMRRVFSFYVMLVFYKIN